MRVGNLWPCFFAQQWHQFPWKREGSSDADKLERACDLLQPPLGALMAAQAYDLVREVRKACAPSWEELLKFAALATREVVVLSLCVARGSMSDIGFESALEHAFERQLGPELRLARSDICRLGRDRTVFERGAPRIFRSTPSPEELQALFTAYAESTNVVVATSVPTWARSHSKKNSW